MLKLARNLPVPAKTVFGKIFKKRVFSPIVGGAQLCVEVMTLTQSCAVPLGGLQPPVARGVRAAI
jgi:hypothetical protein